VDAEARYGTTKRRPGAAPGEELLFQDVWRRERIMAQLTFREAIARGIAQECVVTNRVFLGEDVGGSWRCVKERSDCSRVRAVTRSRYPISEQAILGAAMGASMTGLRPIAEIMFADFFAVCWDIVANEIAKSRT